MIYGTIGGNSQIEFSFDDINNMFTSIQKYTQSGNMAEMYKNLYAHPSIIRDWLSSEYGRMFLNAFNTNLYIDPIIKQLQYSLVMSSINEETNVFTQDINFLNQNDGATSIISNLIKYFNYASNKQLAKTVGSGEDSSVDYKIIIKSILNGKPVSFQSIVMNDRIIKKRGNKQETLQSIHYDGIIHCGANILKRCLEIDETFDKHKHLIKDEAITDIEEFFKLFKKCRIKVQFEILNELNYGEHSFKIIKGKKSIYENFHRIIFDSQGGTGIGHIYMGEYHYAEKRRKDDDMFYTCPKCGKDDIPTYNQKHIEYCSIKDSHEYLSSDIVLYNNPNIYTMEKFDQMQDEYNLIRDKIIDILINEKNPVILTGPGGNGKTFLNNDIINYIYEKYPNIIIKVIAPTGVAANDYDDGRTWQSLFKSFQICGFKDEKKSIDALLARENENEFKKRILKHLKELEMGILIIEEASMINASNMEFISNSLQVIYKNNKPFGGVPTLICGDPGQLSPVPEDENDDSVSFFFQSFTIDQIRKHGYLIEMNHPRRLLKQYPSNHILSITDKENIITQHGILSNKRIGIYDERIFDYIKEIRCNDFEDLLKNGDFLKGNDLIAVKTNKARQYILNKIYKYSNTRMIDIGQDSTGSPLKIFQGMRLLIDNNQTIARNDIINGTPCTVIGWEEKKSRNKKAIIIKVQFDDGSVYNIKRGQGLKEKKQCYPVSCFHVRTIHKLQGVTVETKLYYFSNSDTFKLESKWSPGQMYTLLSRTTNLKDIVFIIKNDRNDLRKHLTEESCRAFSIVAKIINNPKCSLPINACTDEQNHVILSSKTDYSEFIKVKDVAVIAHHNNRKIHIDRGIMENEKIFNNSIILDHETWFEDNGGNEHHTIAFSSTLYYFNGKIVSFDELYLLLGGDESNIDKFKTPRNDKGLCIFDDFYMDNPKTELYSRIVGLINLVKLGIDRFEERKKDTTILPQNYWLEKDKYIKYWVENPLQMIGFNNLNYDDRFLLQHIISNTCDIDFTILNGNGTNFKRIALTYKTNGKSYKLCASFDIMQVSGPGSLESHIQSYVKDNIDDVEKFMSLNSKLYITGKLPENRHILDINDEFKSLSINEKIEIWKNFDNDGKIDYLFDFFEQEWLNRSFKNGSKFKYDHLEEKKFQRFNTRYRQDAETFVERCIIAGIRDLLFLQNLKQHDKKGNVPLKFYCNKSPQWRRENPIIDLIHEMTNENGDIDYSIAFFDPSKGKKLVEEFGIDYFKAYPLHDKVIEYGINDVVLTDLLLRVKNNDMYSFGIEGTILPCAKFDHSWNGMALSILHFKTTSESCLYKFFSNLGKEYLDLKKQKDRPFMICTKLCVITKSMLNDIKNITGGKTQARRICFKSTNDDFLVYLDISGMYSFVQINSDYPYGRLSIYTDSVMLLNYKEQINQSNYDDEIFKKCRIFVFKGKCKNNEIENVVGCKNKEKTRLQYTNQENIYTITNYELKWFIKFGGEITEILKVYEWEFQGPILRDICNYFNDGKQNAKDDVTKKSCKTDANATYGSLLKSDKEKKFVCIRNTNDLTHAFNEALKTSSGGLKNMHEYGDYIVATMEDADESTLRSPTYIGAFTLGGSKALLYEYLYIACGGELRVEDFNNMFGYGDTDSITMTRQCLQRLVEYDSTRDEKDRILFNAGDNKKFKNGKFLDELADDCGKYVKNYAYNPGELEKRIDKSFPNLYTGYHARIIESYNPQSKSGCNKFIFPPTHWQDGRKTTAWDYPEPEQEPWLYGYKNFIKGIDKKSVLRIKIDEFNGIKRYDLDNIDGITRTIIDNIEYYVKDGWGCDEATYEFFKYSNEWSLPITAVRKNKRIEKKTFINSVDEQKGLVFGDIINVPDSGRTVWGYPDNGRIPVYRKEFAEQYPNLLSYSIPELARMGFPLSIVTEGFTVPKGYIGLPTYHSTIRQEEDNGPSNPN